MQKKVVCLEIRMKNMTRKYFKKKVQVTECGQMQECLQQKFLKKQIKFKNTSLLTPQQLKILKQCSFQINMKTRLPFNVLILVLENLKFIILLLPDQQTFFFPIEDFLTSITYFHIQNLLRKQHQWFIKLILLTHYLYFCFR